MAPDAYVAFIGAIRASCGLDLGLYKRPQMERRLRAYAAQQGHADLAALAQAVRTSQDARLAFIAYLTIHVTEFFRDPHFFSVLRRLLHELHRPSSRLRIWSAGCSLGAEPYSVAMLVLQEFGGLQAFSITATDLDEQSLAHARRACYRPDDLRRLDPAWIPRYFTEQPDGRLQVQDKVARHVAFRRHNLLSDPYPVEQDLILFRNVGIYFTDEAKQQVLRRMAGSLSERGILMLGATETVLDPAALGLVKRQPFFFHRMPIHPKEGARQ